MESVAVAVAVAVAVVLVLLVPVQSRHIALASTKQKKKHRAEAEAQACMFQNTRRGFLLEMKRLHFILHSLYFNYMVHDTQVALVR